METNLSARLSAGLSWPLSRGIGNGSFGPGFGLGPPTPPVPPFDPTDPKWGGLLILDAEQEVYGKFNAPSLDFNPSSGVFDSAFGPTPLFTGGGNGTYYDENNILQTYTGSGGRITQGFKGFSTGVLIENEATNVQPNYNKPQDIEHTAGCLIANQAIAPDGTLTAARWNSTWDGAALVYTTPLVTNDAGSLFVKAWEGMPEGEYASLKFGYNETSSRAEFRLYHDDCRLIGYNGAGWGIEKHPNGWWRISFHANNVGNKIRYYGNQFGTSNYHYFWGLQQEVLANTYISKGDNQATSLIPTGPSGSVTREADRCNFTSAQIAEVLTGANGYLLYMEFLPIYDRPLEGQVVLDTDTSVRLIGDIAQVLVPPYDKPFHCKDGDAHPFPMWSLNSEQTIKMAIDYEAGAPLMNLSSDGLENTSILGGPNLGNAQEWHLGCDSTGANYCRGIVNRLTVWPLTASELS